jgi:hypothetical protein
MASLFHFEKLYSVLFLLRFPFIFTPAVIELPWKHILHAQQNFQMIAALPETW